MRGEGEKLWITIAGKSRKQLPSYRTISLDFPVESLASNENHVVAICSNFQAFYFKLSDDGEQLQDPVLITCNDKVLAAVISSGVAILATGAATSPSFERVALGKMDVRFGKVASWIPSQRLIVLEDGELSRPITSARWREWHCL